MELQWQKGSQQEDLFRKDREYRFEERSQQLPQTGELLEPLVSVYKAWQKQWPSARERKKITWILTRQQHG